MTYDKRSVAGEPAISLDCLIIPAAGLGTRMKEVSSDVPKEMLPVCGRPAIEYAVEEGVAAGIKQIIIVISTGKEAISEHFKDYPGPARISFLYQKEPLGESDAIYYAKETAAGRPVAVIYPDNIYVPAPGALKRLLAVYRAYNMDVVALTEVTEDIRHGFSNAGRVDLRLLEDDVYRIEKIHDKTEGSFVLRQKGELRTFGISISGPVIFDYIEKLRNVKPEGELTDVPVRRMVLEARGMLGCRLPGRIFDIGNPVGYRECVKHMGVSV